VAAKLELLMQTYNVGYPTMYPTSTLIGQEPVQLFEQQLP